MKTRVFGGIRRCFLGFAVAALAVTKPLHADPVYDLTRADALCLRMLSYSADVPFRGVSMASGQSVCATKTAGALRLTIPGSSFGLPGVDMEFTGRVTPYSREVVWSIDSAPRRCVMLTEPGGSSRSVYLDTIQGALTMAFESLPVPMQDQVNGVRTLNLLTVRPSGGAGRLAFGVNASCPPGLLGGSVVVRDFVYVGTASSRAALADLEASTSRPARQLNALSIHPTRICQDRSKRMAVPIVGHVSLAQRAASDYVVSLSAGANATLDRKSLSIPKGQYGADFEARIAENAEGSVVFRAVNADGSEAVSAALTVSVYDDLIPRPIACGEIDVLTEYDVFENDPMRPRPPKDIALIDQLVESFVFTAQSVWEPEAPLYCAEPEALSTLPLHEAVECVEVPAETALDPALVAP
jgi:hypothetical protein